MMKIGIIGLDTSHTIEFTKLIQGDETPEAQKIKELRITKCMRFPSAFESESGQDKSQVQLEKWGVKVTISFDEVVKDVDGLMLEINDPGLHLEYFEKAAELNKPIFLDKPLAGNINDGRAILEIAKKKGLKVWSSSSLRFAEAIVKSTQEVSAPVFCNVFGPMGVAPKGSSLIWYGVHSYEMLMTIMGRGARSVLAKQDSKGIVSIVKYADDRRGIVECNEKAWFYGGRVQSKEKVKSFNVDTSDLYHNLIVKIMDFFVNDIIPVDLEDTLEIQVMMDAVERSLESNHEEGIRP